MRKVVGKVTDEERLAIWEINCHKTALEELLLILPSYDALYEQACNDYKETLSQYQDWWNSSYEKYRWEKGQKDWKIIFSTNEIVID